MKNKKNIKRMSLVSVLLRSVLVGSCISATSVAQAESSFQKMKKETKEKIKRKLEILLEEAKKRAKEEALKVLEEAKKKAGQIIEEANTKAKDKIVNL
jgi:cell division septum initiation protein DivIVA